MSAPLGSYFFRSVSSSAGSGGTMIAFATFTPTGTWTTNTTYTGGYSRLGEYMFMNIKMAFAGAPNGVANLTINLPAGFSIDTAKMVQSANVNRTAVVGGGALDGTSCFDLMVTENDATSIFVASKFPSGASGGSFISRNALSATLPVAIANGNAITVWAQFPIVGWAP